MAGVDDDALDLGHGAAAVAEVRDDHQRCCADDVGADHDNEQRLAGVGVDGGEGVSVDGGVGVALAGFAAEVELLEEADHRGHVSGDCVANCDGGTQLRHRRRHRLCIVASDGSVEAAASTRVGTVPSTRVRRCKVDAMFSEASDVRLGLAVWLFSGSRNSDADYEGYVASIARLDAATLATDLKHPAGVLVVDDGNPIPNSHWRKRIADVSTTMHGRPLFALVSTSTLVRGVATAINWIRPPPYEASALATFDEAVAWIAQRHAHATRLYALLAEARKSSVTTPPA